MRNEITAMKLKIMQVLYVEKCIPSSQIELYAMYLRTKGIQIGPSYLYRIRSKATAQLTAIFRSCSNTAQESWR